MARSIADKRAVSVAKTCVVLGTVVAGVSGAEVVGAPPSVVSSSSEDITERINMDNTRQLRPTAHACT